MKAIFFSRALREQIGAMHLYALPLAWQRGIGTEPPFQNPGSATANFLDMVHIE